MATVRRAGPPVPPRPHAILLKTRTVDIGRVSSSGTATPSSSTSSNRLSTGVKSTVVSSASSTSTVPSSSSKPSAPEDGRTVVYKSPSFNLQKRQEQREREREREREKRYSFNTADSTCGGGCGSTIVIERGGHAPAPPIPQLQAKPMVASKKPPKPTAPVPINVKGGDNSLSKNNNNPSLSSMSSTSSSTSAAIDNHRTEVVIVEKNNNGSPSLATNPPQPKPRTLVANKPPGGFLRRSKTTLDNFTRSTITIATISNGDANNNINDTDNGNGNGNSNTNGNGHTNTHSRISNGFMSGRTFDLKNNLKNAAERLFSEIVSHSKESKSQAKTSAASSHLNRSESWMTSSGTGRESNPSELDQNGNRSQQICTVPPSPSMTKLEDPIPPEKKIVFHEMLISELAAMRQRSSSVDQLNTRSDYSFRREFHGYHDGEEKSEDDEKIFEARSEKSMDDKSMDDSGTGSALTLPLNGNGNTNKIKRARQRCPSGCSTDSSPCGPESSRIRTSDWIEVGANGKEEVMTSCHISLEDSGMEDEERPDDGSSGVGDSWDSVQEAKKEEEEEREREMRIKARRQISMADLPPLPKSLSTHLTFNEPNNVDCVENGNGLNNGTSEVIGTTLDKQLSVLRKEMYGLRQLDISLLSQLWTLNDSIQNFRTMLDDEECYSPSPEHSPYPSPYDSVSSDVEEDLSPSIQTQIHQCPELVDFSNHQIAPKHSSSLHSSNASLTTAAVIAPKTTQHQSENRSVLPTAITSQPTSRISIPPTPTPRSPLKSSPPVSIPRQINSKSLPPPPAPPITKPPVERLSLRPSQSFPATRNGNKYPSSGVASQLQIPAPVPVQRMRIAPPPPPVQRRALVSPGRPS
ncbi:rho GTPase-activating protein gacZ [Eupeodes corollae]|uniref:rho GTPase-activating protein gacZ n=1 Tax=Eupeodes corollae TaxID=290404 RepID=UPI002493853E|nr:rho GTPase-activating protein gacZ [Eupeodes corollae]